MGSYNLWKRCGGFQPSNTQTTPNILTATWPGKKVSLTNSTHKVRHVRKHKKVFVKRRVTHKHSKKVRHVRKHKKVVVKRRVVHHRKNYSKVIRYYTIKSKTIRKIVKYMKKYHVSTYKQMKIVRSLWKVLSKSKKLSIKQVKRSIKRILKYHKIYILKLV